MCNRTPVSDFGLTRGGLMVLFAVVCLFSTTAQATEPHVGRAETLTVNGDLAPQPSASPYPAFECGYCSPAEWLDEMSAAVDRGEILDPAARTIPQIAPRRPSTAGAGAPCLTPAHIFPFEDSSQLLLTNFSAGQLIDFMVSAANELMSTHGDNYDFVGYWVNFTPHHTLGTAFYKFIENDVMGIGDASTMGTPLFNFRRSIGLGGENIEGFIMMWGVNSDFWASGDGPNASFTGQEFEHRWAMFLPDLADGRRLQGTPGCGRQFHWSFKVDGQGSGMEIAEWVGSNPATRVGGNLNFNTDIGGVFSYADLYLMGYVSPEEMDAGNSELRYLDDDCSSPYSGPISSFSSADIIETAGPRIPDWTTSQQDFKTAWIMIYQPGEPPNLAELEKAVGISEQHTIDWDASTLGRGTMDNSLFPDCNCNSIPDPQEIADGTARDGNNNGIPDECEPCIGDLDGDGEVGASDLAQLLSGWGPCQGCSEDLDGSGGVGPFDLATLLASWGPCL